MAFDLRALGYFVAAYEERSITAAARRCFIAQPSISTAIKGLEADLGTPLFERTRTGLVPTAGGARLYPRARSLLAESRAVVQDFRATPSAPFTLYLQDDMLASHVGGVLQALSTCLPGATLSLPAQRDQADMRLISAHCKTDGEWLVPLWQEDYVLLIPEAHPLRFKPQFALNDLHGAPFVERPFCALHQTFTRVLAAQGVVLDIRATASREEVVLELVALGLGLAVVPATHAETARNAVVRPLTEPMAMGRRVGLACALDDGPTIELIARLAAAFPHPPKAGIAV